MLLAVAATIVGCAVGWLTQSWLLHALTGLLRADLPPAGFMPVIAGLAVAVAMLAGFALPSLLQLTRVPALARAAPRCRAAAAGAVVSLAPALLALVLVAYGTLREWRLSLWFLGGIAGAALVLGAGRLGWCARRAAAFAPRPRAGAMGWQASRAGVPRAWRRSSPSASACCCC